MILGVQGEDLRGGDLMRGSKCPSGGSKGRVQREDPRRGSKGRIQGEYLRGGSKKRVEGEDSRGGSNKHKSNTHESIQCCKCVQNSIIKHEQNT